MSEDEKKIIPLKESVEKEARSKADAVKTIEDADKVLVKSEGTPATTSVVTSDGSRISNITSIWYEQGASDLGRLLIEIIVPEVSFAAKADFKISDSQRAEIKGAIEGKPEVAEAMVEMMEEVGFIFLKRTK